MKAHIAIPEGYSCSRPAKAVRYIKRIGCHECISHIGHNADRRPVLYRNHKRIILSRWLWEKEYGKIKKGLFVCHKCDNPGCININHFFLGTMADNCHDRDIKGRAAIGERSGKVKFTDKQIVDIYLSTESWSKTAKKYNTSKAYVGAIKSGRRRFYALKKAFESDWCCQECGGNHTEDICPDKQAICEEQK